MSINLTLDDIVNEAEKTYPSLRIDGIEMRHPIRLSKERRAELSDLQDRLNEAREALSSAENEKDVDPTKDMVPLLEDMVRATVQDKKEGDALVRKFGGDVAMLTTVVTKYGEATQMGEASPSES